MIVYRCAGCGETLETDDAQSMQTERCPVCGHVNAVPKSRKELRRERREQRAQRRRAKRALKEAAKQRRRELQVSAHREEHQDTHEVSKQEVPKEPTERATLQAQQYKQLRMSLGVIGSVLLVFGAFAPLISVPFVGSITYIMRGEGDGVIVVVLGLLSLVLAVAGQFNALWFTGLASLGLMAFTFYNVRSGLDDMRESMASELAGNPFRGLAEVAVEAVQFQWGWGVLLVGAVLILVAAALPNRAA